MKKRRLPPLGTLQGFEASARLLSFTKAAEELYVTQGAISRQVRELEEHLKVSLFDRYTRKIELTDAGRELYAVVGDLFERLSAVTVRIQRRSKQEFLTVSVLPTFASAWLMPRLHLFTESYPNIEVRLHTSIDPVEFRSNGPDVAVRVGRIPGWHYDRKMPRIDLEMTENWRGIHVDALFADRLVPVCSSKLVADDRFLTPEEMTAYPLIHNTTRRFAWPDWLRAHDVSPPPDKAETVEFGHFFMCVQAARQGRGIALIPDIIAQEEIDAGTLRVPFNADIDSAGHYCLLVPDGNLERSTIRAFREWIIDLAKLRHA
jgi:LysR family transcriptional regulator, glycine cleavage system transcriptional activator